MFSGVLRNFWSQYLPTLGFRRPVEVSKLSPDRLHSGLSLTVYELSKLIHKLLFFKLEKRDGLSCVLSGLNVVLGSAVGVHCGDGLMGDSGDF